jgi:hypothetical protein
VYRSKDPDPSKTVTGAPLAINCFGFGSGSRSGQDPTRIKDGKKTPPKKKMHFRRAGSLTGSLEASPRGQKSFMEAYMQEVLLG